jgi:hypothetical protein
MKSRVIKSKIAFWVADQDRLPGEPSLAVQSAIEDYDRQIWEAERIWGVDRLPSLVSDDTRQRWWTGIAMLNTAIRDNNAVMVKALVDNMIVGLQKMILEAETAGYKPLAPDIWEAPLSDGRVLQIVRNFPIGSYQPDNRNLLVWPLEDVARLIEHQEAINTVKKIFPGATITDIREKVDTSNEDT